MGCQDHLELRCRDDKYLDTDEQDFLVVNTRSQELERATPPQLLERRKCCLRVIKVLAGAPATGDCLRNTALIVNLFGGPNTHHHASRTCQIASIRDLLC